MMSRWISAVPAGASLEVSGVTVVFGGHRALDGVGLTAEPGRVTGLIGPNGAGKSTLFAALSGLLRPAEGRVLMGGEDVTRASPQARARRGLARTFQRPELFSGLTVREHLVLADRVRHSSGRIWRDLLIGGGFRKPSKEEDERVDGLLDALRLGDLRHRKASGLSLGTSRLLEVARALAVEPEVLMLDEPSSGLDVRETGELAETLMRVVEERGLSLLLVEHDVDLVLGMCDTVNVLDFGVMIASGPPDAIRDDPAVRAAYLGEEPSAGGGAGDRNKEES